MFAKLKIGSAAKAANKFTPIHPDPAIGKSHGISLNLHGKHSEEYRNAIASTLRRAKRRELTVDESIEESVKVIVACCTGWEGVTEDDKAVKYDGKKLAEYLNDDDYRWMRLQAEQFMAQDDNFF
jgi:hypothetical protein